MTSLHNYGLFITSFVVQMYYLVFNIMMLRLLKQKIFNEVAKID